MAYVAVDKDGSEFIYHMCPEKIGNKYAVTRHGIGFDSQSLVILPKGTIKKLIGKSLTFDDAPVQLK